MQRHESFMDDSASHIGDSGLEVGHLKEEEGIWQ